MIKEWMSDASDEYTVSQMLFLSIWRMQALKSYKVHLILHNRMDMLNVLCIL